MSRSFSTPRRRGSPPAVHTGRRSDQVLVLRGVTEFVRGEHMDADRILSRRVGRICAPSPVSAEGSRRVAARRFARER